MKTTTDTTAHAREMAIKRIAIFQSILDTAMDFPCSFNDGYLMGVRQFLQFLEEAWPDDCWTAGPTSEPRTLGDHVANLRKAMGVQP